MTPQDPQHDLLELVRMEMPFGKYKGRKVTDVFRENPGYYSWIQNADFPLYTKKVLTGIKESMTAKKQISTLDDLKNKFNKKV